MRALGYRGLRISALLLSVHDDSMSMDRDIDTNINISKRIDLDRILSYKCLYQ